MNTPHTEAPKPIPPAFKAGRIVGIDYGMARIGIAVSDETKMIATSLETLPADRKALATVGKLLDFFEKHTTANRYHIEALVIGMPLMMSGKKGMLADEVVHFVALLKERVPYPIVTWDERLSSVQADRSLREGNFSRKRRSKMVDAVAATIILQSYLDHLRLKM
jgi:putative Holliday junction resolvase